MILGLRHHAHKSLRLEIFAESLGVPHAHSKRHGKAKAHERKVLPASRHSLMLSVLLATVALVDAERGSTRTRKDMFYARFGEYNELYLPLDYLLRGLREATSEDLNVDFQEHFAEAVEERAVRWSLPSEAACHAEAKGMSHKRKGAVLAGRCGGPFINIDRFLALYDSPYHGMTLCCGTLKSFY